jgi:hypothetical protein
MNQICRERKPRSAMIDCMSSSNTKKSGDEQAGRGWYNSGGFILLDSIEQLHACYETGSRSLNYLVEKKRL